MNEYENALNRIKRNVIPDNWTECDVAHYKTIEKALEKQIPKHIKEQTEEDREFIDYVCPNCKTTLQQKMKGASRTTIYKYKHCIFCGQTLGWSDTD